LWKRGRGLRFLITGQGKIKNEAIRGGLIHSVRTGEWGEIRREKGGGNTSRERGGGAWRKRGTDVLRASEKKKKVTDWVVWALVVM